MDCVAGMMIPENGNVVLSLQGIGQSFVQNDGSVKKVLEDLDLEVPDLKGKPQILSILGPSGGGKTTLTRIIAGFDSPTTGTIKIQNCKEGAEYSLDTTQSGKIGVIFQKNPLFPDITVIENLTHAVIRLGTKPHEAREKATMYLHDFNLLEQKDSFPAQLSGGQVQRAAILQQLMIPDRHFLILDEPFSRLDSESIMAVIKLLDKIAMTHDLNTFIVVTHDTTSALIISDHIHLLGRPSPDKGSKFVHSYDLIKEGLAYHPNIEDIPRFNEIRKEIKYEWMPKL